VRIFADVVFAKDRTEIINLHAYYPSAGLNLNLVLRRWLVRSDNAKYELNEAMFQKQTLSSPLMQFVASTFELSFQTRVQVKCDLKKVTI